MFQRIPQGISKRVTAPVYLAADHISPATGKTIPVKLSKNGAPFSDPSGGALNLAEIGNGFYCFDLSTTDTGTAGPLAVYAADGAGLVDPVRLVFEVADPHNAGFDGIPAAAAGTGGGLPTANASNQVKATDGNGTALATHADVAALPNAAAIVAAMQSPGTNLAQLVAAIGTLSADQRDAVADALLNRAAAIDGKTPKQVLQIIAAVLAGKVSGAGTGTETFRALSDATDRVQVVVDNLGNRIGVSYTADP
jgi:hypothetical protein